MRDDFSVDDGSADRLLEIFVETLMGTVFEMTLSSLETIANIKLRLQRLEGIPRQQMHLLFMGYFHFLPVSSLDYHRNVQTHLVRQDKSCPTRPRCPTAACRAAPPSD